MDIDDKIPLDDDDNLADMPLEEDLIIKKLDLSQSVNDNIEVNWDMFVKESQLGQGAYGNVYKVKSFQSTRCGKGNAREFLSKKSLKKASEAHLQAKRGIGMAGIERALIKD